MCTGYAHNLVSVCSWIPVDWCLYVPKSQWIPLTKLPWIPRTNTCNVNFVGTFFVPQNSQETNIASYFGFRNCKWILQKVSGIRKCKWNPKKSKRSPQT